jgi:DNA polymerase-3 subunit epsilon
VSNERGIQGRLIKETPIAVLDFETTGLSPGGDRVIEISVVRRDPGQRPRLVFDTLVNPGRRVAATHVHGIRDADVADAPAFGEIAGDLVEVLSGCVLSAYNVYFDIRFLEYELALAGVNRIPPHFCLMYLRPMLGLGDRCRLDAACACHGITLEAARYHSAAADTVASGELLELCLERIDLQGLRTFGDLARLRASYKFLQSFSLHPLPGPAEFQLTPSGRCRPRRS